MLLYLILHFVQCIYIFLDIYYLVTNTLRWDSIITLVNVIYTNSIVIMLLHQPMTYSHLSMIYCPIMEAKLIVLKGGMIDKLKVKLMICLHAHIIPLFHSVRTYISVFVKLCFSKIFNKSFSSVWYTWYCLWQFSGCLY